MRLDSGASLSLKVANEVPLGTNGHEGEPVGGVVAPFWGIRDYKLSYSLPTGTQLHNAPAETMETRLGLLPSCNTSPPHSTSLWLRGRAVN